MPDTFIAADTAYGDRLLLKEGRYLSTVGAQLDDDGIIDEVAVTRFLDGHPVRLTPREVVCAVAACAWAGKTDPQIAALFGRTGKAGTTWVFGIRRNHRIDPGNPAYLDDELAVVILDPSARAKASLAKLRAAGVAYPDADTTQQGNVA